MLASQIEERRANPAYLPDVNFPANLHATGDLGSALRDTDLIVTALPSHGARDILRRAAPHVGAGAIVVSATKGLERDTCLLYTSDAADE